MKRLKYAIWALTLTALPFASCSKDDDNDSKTPSEKPKEDNNDNKDDKTPDKVKEKEYLDKETSATKLGEESKDVIDLFLKDSEGEGNVLSTALELSDQQINQLAKLLVNYNNNSENQEWMNEFLKSVSSSAEETMTIKSNMTTILEEVNKVVPLEGIPASELAVAIGKYLSSEGTKSDGVKAGAEQKPLFDEIYESKLKNVNTIEEAYIVYPSLSEEQQKGLIVALTTYKAHKENKEWVDGFFSGVGVTNPEDVEHLKGLFDQFEQYLPLLGAM